MSDSHTSQNLKSLKNVLVDTILLAGTSIGLLAFMVSLFPFEPSIINADFYYDIIGISALFITYFFRKRLGVEFKTNMIIAMLYVLFVSDILENGLDTPDFILVLIIPFLSILVYNFSITILLYSACIITSLILGYLFTTGTISSIYYDGTQDSFFRWIEWALILSVVTFVITLFLNRFDTTIAKLFEDLTEQNDSLAERESVLTAITQNIPRTYLSIIDSDLIIQFTEGAEYGNANLNPKDFIGLYAPDTFRIFDAKLQNQVLNAYQNTLEGKNQVFELKMNDGYYLFKTVPLINSGNKVKSFLVVTENITEFKKTQQLLEENLNEKNVLLQEIHHRVKNNLAVVSGLLELQSHTVEDAKSKFILSKSTNRIMSIAKVHEMLYESKNFNKIPFDQYISELSTIILDSMNNEAKNIQFSTNIEVDYISINHGVPLGIIFNELITNSVKYGFNGSSDNQINIDGSQKQDEFEVIYHDNGVGIEDFDSAISKSLGFTLIHSLMDQIDASYEYETNGRFTLQFSFPAESISNPYQINEDTGV